MDPRGSTDGTLVANELPDSSRRSIHLSVNMARHPLCGNVR
jgi:hypothetical protein